MRAGAGAAAQARRRGREEGGREGAPSQPPAWGARRRRRRAEEGLEGRRLAPRAARRGGVPRGRGKSRGRGREAAGGSRTVGRRDAGTAQGPRSRRGAGAQGAGGPGRGSGRGASTFFAFSSSGSFRPIDTCARPAPAANIFLMSSRGLERARSALQGGFSPGRCFGRRRRARPPGGGHKSLSLSPRGESRRLSSKVQKKDELSLGPQKCISRRTMGSFLRLRGPAGREERGPVRLGLAGRLAPFSTPEPRTLPRLPAPH